LIVAFGGNCSNNDYRELSGFSVRNLFNMIRFAEVFSNKKIVHALSAQLTWTHFREIICLHNNLQRNLYAEMCRKNKRSDRAAAIG